MIVGAEKVERRIVQTRLLQTEINRIGTLCCAETTSTQALVRLPRIFILVGQSNLQTTLASAFEHAQDIAGLRDLPTRDWIEKRKHAFGSSLR